MYLKLISSGNIRDLNSIKNIKKPGFILFKRIILQKRKLPPNLSGK